jgi:hypothetical protein
MPHLQLDVGATYPLPVKRQLAQHRGRLCAEIMQTTPDLVDITITVFSAETGRRTNRRSPYSNR